MNGAGILSGLRVVEGSAFVAMPLGGMTLAQLGADVIRFDPIGGGLDYTRWPVTLDGQHSLFWAGLNKGKRSIAIDFRKPEGQELLTQLICAPGENAGLFLTNFPIRGWLGYEILKAQREDLIMVNLSGRWDGTSEVDYTVNPQVGFPMVTGPTSFHVLSTICFPRGIVSPDKCPLSACWRRSGTGDSPETDSSSRSPSRTWRSRCFHTSEKLQK